MKNKSKLIIALGSNYNQVRCMDIAETMLAAMFDYDVVYSKRIWTEPIGIKSDRFLNRIIIVDTSHSVMQIRKALQDVKRRISGTRRLSRSDIVFIDLDILQYGNTKYHEKDWERDYIRELLADIDGQIDK